jgi:hypothetical protein
MVYAAVGVQVLLDSFRGLRRAARRPTLAKNLLLSPSPSRQTQRVGA